MKPSVEELSPEYNRMIYRTIYRMTYQMIYRMIYPDDIPDDIPKAIPNDIPDDIIGQYYRDDISDDLYRDQRYNFMQIYKETYGMSLLSVIVPCYNEEESVALFYQELTKNDTFFKEKDIELELLYIDDGSKDGTVREVKKLIEADPRVHIISFSRNFGKEAAMFAGLEKSKGDYVVMMDVDLQDPPSLLPEMFEWIWKGYDSVATRRVTRKGEPPIRSFFARRFYQLMKKISKTEMMDGARDYRLMTRQMVDAILSMREYNRFTKGIFGWVGFNTKWLEYENVERAKGETKWNFWKLLVYSLDGITAFSTAPLLIASFVGVLFCVIAFLMIIFIIVRKLIFGDPVSGWPSLVCIILMTSGVQFFCTGILGQYLAKAYMEVKRRPIYLVKEEI